MQREEPDFVATIGDAPPTRVDAPTTMLAPTAEYAAPPFAPSPEPAAPAAAAPNPGARPPGRLTRPRHRRVMSRVLLVAIVAAFSLYVAGVGGDLVSMLRGGASARTVPAEGGSLLRAVALQAALKGLPENGRLEGMRVAADRIDARVVVDGRIRLVRVTDKGWVTDLPAPEQPTGTTVRIDTRAPARIVQTVLRRTNRKPDSISHLALEGRRWQLVFSDGAQFSADARGRDVHRG